MGRTVVVRDSYTKEVKKLEWLDKSIELDSRVPRDRKVVASSLIKTLKETLTTIQSEINNA